VASPSHCSGVHLQTLNLGAKEGLLKVGVDADGEVNMQAEGGLESSPHHRRHSYPPRRRRTRVVAATPRRRGTLDADFGGSKHAVYDASGNKLKNEWRPEVVKSERCDDTACHMCHHKVDDGCWNGGKGTPGKGSGDMVIAVKLVNGYTSFAQEIFFACPLDEKKNMFVQAREINNGKIHVHNNNKPVQCEKAQGVDGEVMGPWQRRDNGAKATCKFKPATTNRVRLVFVPMERNSESSAVAKLEAKAMTQSTDNCLSIKNCLAELGDGSDAAFELRNDNNMQRMCLESDSSLPDHLNATCTVWQQCLPEENREIIKTLLKVSQTLLKVSQPMVTKAAIIVLGDKGSHSCPSGSMDFTEIECSKLGTLTYSVLRAGYAGTGSYGNAVTWTSSAPGCMSAGTAYYFNRATSNAHSSGQFKLCKEASGEMVQQIISASGSASFADVVSATANNLTVLDDPNDCIDPAIEDPESYECECAEKMIKTCQGVDEACFKRFMCNSDQVCRSWKEDVGCTSALLEVDGDLNAALGQRSQEKVSNGIGDALDGSLQGKCSQ